MTREEAIARIRIHKNVHKMNEPRAINISEALDMGIKALEQEPCEDAISRQAVEETIFAEGSCEKLDIDFAKIWLLLRAIKALPSVTPYPKTERCRWIRYDYRTICPQNHDIDNPYWRIPEKRMDVLKYCPYCGKEIEVTE